jgi:glycerophosphoryl diester phosphodiesterase
MKELVNPGGMQFMKSSPISFWSFVVLLAFPVLPDSLAGPSEKNHPDPVLVAAHRGGYANEITEGAPENSVANVEVAVRKGFDLYETDVVRTKDGVFVIIHDPTIDRETTGQGPTIDMTLADLKSLQKRFRDGSVSDEKVATVEELFLAGKGRIRFKPDLKFNAVDHFDELARLTHRLDMVDDVFFRCEYEEVDKIAAAFDAGAPKVEVMVRVLNADQVREIASRLSPRSIHIEVNRGGEITPEQLEAIQTALELGLLVQTHSFRDFDQLEALVKAGVRMVHTNNPDETLVWLKENGWR